jgi:hypothetical protein
MGKAELQTSLNALDIWLIVFGVVVAIGAVGGSVAGFLHWRRAAQLQTILESENLALQSDIAHANARALEAQLALEKYRAPRSLTVEQQNRISEKLRPLGVVQFDAAVIHTDAETHYLLDMITPALAATGWTQVDWGNDSSVLKRPGKPDVGEWAATNVIIAVPNELISRLGTAANQLAAALTEEGIPAQAQDAQGMVVKNHDVLHLLIGRKM